MISRGCCCFKLLLFGLELLCWELLVLLFCNCCLWNCFCCCVLIDGDLTNVGMWHCMESCDLNVLDMDFRFPPRGVNFVRIAGCRWCGCRIGGCGVRVAGGVVVHFVAVVVARCGIGGKLILLMMIPGATAAGQ